MFTGQHISAWHTLEHHPVLKTVAEGSVHRNLRLVILSPRDPFQDPFGQKTSIQKAMDISVGFWSNKLVPQPQG
jgi:hypothetical protein